MKYYNNIMNRAINNSIPKTRHKKIIKLSKGYKGSLSKLFIAANQTVLKALKYSYTGRKNKKREYINLWTKRINASCKINNTNYSIIKKNIKKKSIILNRKIIAKICLSDKKMLNNFITI